MPWDRQHIISQWYLRNFSISEDGNKIEKDKSSIYRHDFIANKTEKKKIRKVAYKNKYLTVDADEIISQNEIIVSKLVTDIVKAKNLGEISKAQIQLFCLNDSPIEICSNLKELCRFIDFQLVRSKFMRTVIKNGFDFDLLTNQREVKLHGKQNFTDKQLRVIQSDMIHKIHSNHKYESDNMAIALFETLEITKNGETHSIDDETIERIKELMKTDPEYQKIRENKRVNKTTRENCKIHFSCYFEKYFMILILNKSEIPFITADFPVFTVNFNESKAVPFLITSPAFIPISPQMAIALLDKETYFSNFYEMAKANKNPLVIPFCLQMNKSSEIHHLNSQIIKSTNTIYFNSMHYYEILTKR